MNNGSSQYSSYQSSSGSSSNNLTDAVVDTMVRLPVDTMVRLPMRMTGATMDLMLQGVQAMTGAGRGDVRSGGSRSSSMSYDSSSSPSSSSQPSNANTGWSSLFSNQASGTFDQDLSGDDLKYVIYSIVFTKPGYECILQKQQEDLVAYAADSSTYAAVKIAKFLDSARYGHSERPENWRETGYASAESGKSKSNRKEQTTVITTPTTTSVQASSSGSENRENREHRGSGENEKGWRIPPEDQKFISFIYRVERRLPKQEEVQRVERVTVERGTRVV
jgi:hypothetical protein